MPISKTQRKRQVLALQDLGVELVALNEERLAMIELPEALRDAVLEARRITTHEARRRQLQYIGKLMRGMDPVPIRAALDAWRARARGHTALLKRTELWRERLLAEPGALAELLAVHPQADARRLRALVRSALAEHAANRPPKSYRALYQALRALIEKGMTKDGNERW